MHEALVYPAAGVARHVDDPGSASGRTRAEVPRVVQKLQQAIRDAGGGEVPAVAPPAIGPRRALSTDLAATSEELLDVLASLQHVEHSLRMLRRKQPLREFVFPDHGSTIGRLVALLQAQAGRISARWYARYLLLQQNEINTLLLVSIQNLTLAVQQLAHATGSLSSARSTLIAADEHSPTDALAATDPTAQTDRPRDR
jgi:hypothetical protein